MNITATKIEATNLRGIPVADMESENIGRIVAWAGGNRDYVGLWVRRMGTHLFSLTTVDHWPGMFHGVSPSECRIELLKPGEILQLEVVEETAD